MHSNRFFFSIVLTLALILVPLSYLPAHAQGTAYPSQQNDQVKQNQSDVNNQNQNVNKNMNRENRYSSSQSQTQSDVNKGNPSREKSSTSSQTKRQTTTETNQTEATNTAALPRTAGELPLLALIGVLSLISAAGLRLVRNRG